MTRKQLVAAAAIALASAAGGCSELMNAGPGIMQAAPGDPVGSANTGTGSVTVGSTPAPEAKSAGIGLGP